MFTRVTSGSSADRSSIRRGWRLFASYWQTDDITEVRHMGLSFRIQEKWLGRALLITIVGLLMLSIYLLKLSNEWNAKFFNALQEKDSVAFWHQMRNLGFLVFFIAAVSAHRTWLRQLFVIRWRRWLTNKYMTEWLSDRRFYKMEL